MPFFSFRIITWQFFVFLTYIIKENTQPERHREIDFRVWFSFLSVTVKAGTGCLLVLSFSRFFITLMTSSHISQICLLCSVLNRPPRPFVLPPPLSVSPPSVSLISFALLPVETVNGGFTVMRMLKRAPCFKKKHYRGLCYRRLHFSVLICSWCPSVFVTLMRRRDTSPHAASEQTI